MNLIKKIQQLSPQIQCDFALQPIPKEYYFENFSNFVQPFDKKLIPYPDIHFVNSKLIPHFKESLQILKKNIDNLNKEIESTKEILQNSLLQSQECLSIEYKNNFLNQNIIRNLKILTPKREELKRTVLLNQISFLEKRLELLKSIEKVTIFLINSPRYYCINLQFLEKSNDFHKQEPEIYLEYDSITRKIKFLESQLSYINDPFTKCEENFDFTMLIISLLISLKIPQTKCVKDSEQIEIFRIFLESKNSPIQFTFFSTSSKDIDIQIKMMVNNLFSFCRIFTYDAEMFDVLYFILFRFFIEIFIEKFELYPLKIERTSQILNNNLDCLKLSTMKDLGLSSQFPEFLDLNANELFERNSQLIPLFSQLLMCHFLINPIEIFFIVQKIGICLKSVFKNENDLCVAWKALFIESSVPSVDLIFKKLSHFRYLDPIISLYDSVCEIPNRVIDELSNPE